MEQEELGGYRLLEQLGSGGMGIVHLGVDGDGNPVAVKVLHAHIANDETARARLAREVRTLRRIKHPRIAEVLDAELDSDHPFIITEFVDGMTLSDDVRQNGPFAEDELVHFGHGLLDALRAVHDAGVIHRDLKPANVMIMDGEPMVIDFGIAQVADEVRVTATGLVMGTPGYLSPEIADGKPSNEKTDWWGWAATMAFAATGRNPYGSGPLEAVLGRVAMGRSDLTGVPSLFVPLLRACLDPRPERRPSGDMILEALVDIESGRMPTLGQSRRPGPPVPRPGPGGMPVQAGVPRQQHPGAGRPVPGGAGGTGAGVVVPPGPHGRPAGPGGPRPGPPTGPGGQVPPGAPTDPRGRGAPTGPPPHRPGPGSPQGRPGPGAPPGGPGPNAPARQAPAGSGPRPGARPYGPLGLDRPQGSGPAPGTPVPHRPNAPAGAPGQMPGAGVGGGQGTSAASFGNWAVLGMAFLGTAMTPLGPFVVAFLSFLWVLAARTVANVLRYRHRTLTVYGPGALSTMGSVGRVPLALLAEAALGLVTHVLPIVAALAVAVLMRLDPLGIVPDGMSEVFSLWAAGAVAGVVLWLGPGSVHLRVGSRQIVRAVVRIPVGQWIALAGLATVGVLAIAAVVSGAATLWWPAGENLFSHVPMTN
ncbi:serine/threonine-protein kinase [Brevibacterium litoralis]|uniref:serine/threonine-protein kinase n=1 Tax=Brevibacterium litoralis TaxID=3138935 RepID=UPI0032EDDE50